MSDVILEMRNITKTFPGVKALDNVSFAVKQGEIHALVGENGAGKSTLMKVLSGVYPYGSYSGEIHFQGQECRFNNINQSEEVGLVIIHQELALISYLSITENLFLGNERAKYGVINWNEAISKTKELLERVGLHESPNTLITNMGVGKQQLVEIAKALAKKVKLLILDEPTASLNDTDSEKLLQLLLQFKSHGISSILISHKLSEVSRVADSITILRDGATIETLDCHKDSITEDRIIRGMVGRDLTHRFPPRDSKIGADRSRPRASAPGRTGRRSPPVGARRAGRGARRGRTRSRDRAGGCRRAHDRGQQPQSRNVGGHCFDGRTDPPPDSGRPDRDSRERDLGARTGRGGRPPWCRRRAGGLEYLCGDRADAGRARPDRGSAPWSTGLRSSSAD